MGYDSSRNATDSPSTLNSNGSFVANAAESLGPNSQVPHPILTTSDSSTLPPVMLLMQAGDVVRVDFGVPARGEPGFIRPAVIITSNDVLEFRQHAVLVVPCTTNAQGWLTDVEVDGFGIAQAHLPTTISVDRIVQSDGTNVGPVALQQIREAIADLLGF